MNVLVLTAAELFARGPFDKFQRDLVDNLRRRKINAETVTIPTGRSLENLIDDTIMSRAFRLWNVDRVIALRHPAYLVPHPNKVCWLIEHWSERYEVLEARDISDSKRNLDIARLLEQSDSECLGKLRRLFVSSPVIRAQIKTRNDLESELLPLPTSVIDWDHSIEKLLS